MVRVHFTVQGTIFRRQHQLHLFTRCYEFGKERIIPSSKGLILLGLPEHWGKYKNDKVTNINTNTCAAGQPGPRRCFQRPRPTLCRAPPSRSPPTTTTGPAQPRPGGRHVVLWHGHRHQQLQRHGVHANRQQREHSSSASSCPRTARSGSPTEPAQGDLVFTGPDAVRALAATNGHATR